MLLMFPYFVIKVSGTQVFEMPAIGCKVTAMSSSSLQQVLTLPLIPPVGDM